jgi:hypothetical protein
MILNIVCPFCDQEHPVPTDFDCVYACDCGACYKICSSTLLERGMRRLAREVWDEDCLPVGEAEDTGFCQVVVNREFDQLLSLKQDMDTTSELRFCKYDPSSELALVWMKRP